MSQLQDIHIKIGEVKLGRDNQVLETFVGSCVGIAFLFHGETTKYALAHCLLPESPPGGQLSIGAKYVDQAIKSLLALMKIKEEDFKHLRAVVAGGANMTQSTLPPEKLVGAANSKSALTHLKKLGIKVIFEDLGGFLGRKIILNCSTGEFKVSEIKKTQAA